MVDNWIAVGEEGPNVTPPLVEDDWAPELPEGDDEVDDWAGARVVVVGWLVGTGSKFVVVAPTLVTGVWVRSSWLVWLVVTGAGSVDSPKIVNYFLSINVTTHRYWSVTDLSSHTDCKTRCNLFLDKVRLFDLDLGVIVLKKELEKIFPGSFKTHQV